MAELTKIEWADHTWNPWEGCQKVGPGCDWCYAWVRNARFGGGTAPNWGPGAPRRKTSTATWNNPLKWNRDADRFFAEHGRRQGVFCASLADLFDNAVPIEWVLEACYRMEECHSLEWLPLTKRVGNVETRIPWSWRDGHWPKHIGLMITVVNQPEADRDIDKLRDLKARFGIPWVGISYEPALGPIDITPWLDQIDWVIAGGESGPNARPAHPDWFRAVRDQCAAAGVAFLFKQWGEWRQPDADESYDTSRGRAGKPPAFRIGHDGNVHCFQTPSIVEPSAVVIRVGKKRAGRLLDGIEHNGFPEALR